MEMKDFTCIHDLRVPWQLGDSHKKDIAIVEECTGSFGCSSGVICKRGQIGEDGE